VLLLLLALALTGPSDDRPKAGIPISGGTFTGAVAFAPYMQHMGLDITAAALGPTAPALTTLGTMRCYTFTVDAESIHISIEYPGEVAAGTDPILELDVYTQSGDALADGEMLQLDVTYRSITNGDAYDSGTAAVSSGTRTGGASETDKGGYRLSVVLDVDDANQPLTGEDHIMMQIDRDVSGSDTYSGAAYLCHADFTYYTTQLARH
jgi:hypothetical protein